ncbi:MAG TPA: bacteriohemerythrin, partial [Patescibacteria group bacterium]|nr:bacteriohemerythrin [Patescibacteria group bacterium]
DDQHKRFIRLINDLYEAKTESMPKARIGQILDQLLRYAAQHFATEEKLLELFQYQSREEHARTHKKILAQALEYHTRFQTEGAHVIQDFLPFFVDWLVNHMTHEDKGYIECLHKNGLH